MSTRATSLILLLCLLLSPRPVLAAFAVSDDFESYSVGDLTGGNGGSGWSAAWSGNVLYDVQNTVVYEGSKAVSNVMTANQSHSITRDLTSEVSGDFYVAWRRTNVANSCGYFILREGASARGYLKLPCTGSSGNQLIYNNSVPAYETVASSLVANTWYILHVQFDASTDQYRARIYSSGAWGSYTAYKGMVAGSGISRIEILHEGEASTAGTMYVDKITTTDPTAGGGGSTPAEFGDFIMFN